MIIMIIDHRERELIARLSELKVQHKVMSLLIGDVIIGKFIIELKKGGDLVGSVYDKRLFFQKAKMKYTELKPVLIIYDLKNIYEFARNRNIINGVMASYIFNNDLVIPLDTIDDVIFVLQKLERKVKEGPTLQNPSIYWNFPKFKNIKERRIAALSCGENIGYVKAKVLIEKFKTPEGVIRNLDEIPQLKNFSDKSKQNISLFLTNRK